MRNNVLLASTSPFGLNVLLRRGYRKFTSAKHYGGNANLIELQMRWLSNTNHCALHSEQLPAYQVGTLAAKKRDEMVVVSPRDRDLDNSFYHHLGFLLDGLFLKTDPKFVSGCINTGFYA